MDAMDWWNVFVALIGDGIDEYRYESIICYPDDAQINGNMTVWFVFYLLSIYLFLLSFELNTCFIYSTQGLFAYLGIWWLFGIGIILTGYYHA